MKFEITPDHVFIEPVWHFKSRIEKELNGVYTKGKKMYKFPKNVHVMRELIQAFPELRSSSMFVGAGQQLKQAQQRLLDIKMQTDLTGNSRLRPYQRVDVAYLRQLPAAGIFNEPRTGKTPTSIHVMKELGTSMNLIVCPASLIWNWAKEFEKWDPVMEVYVVSGTPKKREELIERYRNKMGFKEIANRRVLIVSKDTWKGMAEDWRNFTFDAVFVDEAHYLRNYKTAQSKAVYQIQAKRRYVLTGTPTVKHASDIWGILHFLYPTKFSSYWQFVARYFEEETDYMGHRKVGPVKLERQNELQELIGFVSVQRKRKDVMQWLPDKERITFYCAMEGKQAKLYQQMAEDFLAFDEETEHAIDTSNILAQTMRMRQLCLDPRLLGFDEAGVKTKALIEWIEDNPGPVVIMSQFTSYLKMLAREFVLDGRKVGMIHGEMSNQEKQDSATRFQAQQIDILLCNIISAGTGFTLDAGDTIIFTDKAWNPSDNEQAEDRITPTVEANLHKHTIISFVCKDSFDERVNTILEQKKSLTDVINEGGREAIAKLLRGN